MTTGWYQRRIDRARCRECGRKLSEVAPRNVIVVSPEAHFTRGRKARLLRGLYCSSDCILDAQARGFPAHH